MADTQSALAFPPCYSLQDTYTAAGGSGLTVNRTVMDFTAIELNKREHKYEIRSSDALFLGYILTLLTSSLTIYILYIDPSTNNDNETSIRCLSAFTISIAFAFAVEAAPRSNTQVQISARNQDNCSTYDQANFLSRWTFHFIQDVVSAGARRTLVSEDLKNTMAKDLMTHTSYETISVAWEKELARAQKANKEPSFMLSSLRTYRRKIITFITIRLIAATLAFYPTVLFGELLQFFVDYHGAPKEGHERPTITYGLLIATGMLLASLISTGLMAQNFQGLYEIGNQLCSGTIAMVYRKSLRLSPQARQKATLGEITNHMAVDAEKWIMSAFFFPFLILIPFELVLGGYLLYKTLGWSLLAGLAVFCIIAPIQGKMATFMSGFEDEKLERMDARLRLMTEILSNIKIVKLYGWEDAFRKKIDIKRDEELHSEKMLATNRSILTIVFSSVTLLMSLATFGVYTLYGGPNMTPGKLTSQVIFVGIALFARLNRPLGMVAHTISVTISIRIATRRIQKFLVLEEIDTSIVERFPRQGQQGPLGSSKAAKKGFAPIAIDIDNGTFAWELEATPAVANVDVLNTKDTLSDAEGERQPLLSGSKPLSSSSSSTAATPGRPTLANISLQIPEGHLTAVVGRIGQGKSSLISALMGEMYKKQGTVRIYGDLAYVPQQPWIINATVQENITFGKRFDQELYDRIIYASGLRPDLDMLPAGDQTEIGERGINLSGGQKQRISLARAAYQDADIYLLDDPLSAVDAHVDQHLWKELIGPQGLLKNKTRVLVTHGIHHLEEVDQIVVLKDGMVSELGDYRHLTQARGAFYQLMKEYSVARQRAPMTRKHSKDATVVEAAEIDSERNTIVGEDFEQDDAKKSGEGEGGEGEDDKAGELIAEETMVDGKVSWKVAIAYARAVTFKNAFFCLFLYVAGQACQLGTNFWLRHWILNIEASESLLSATASPAKSTAYYLTGYGIMILLFVITDVMANYMSEVVCGIQASKTIHNRLITRVLRLPMSFFDTTPTGRIVNRFSSDMAAIDSQLPEECNDLMAFTTLIGASLMVIAYSTPAFLFFFPPLLFAFMVVQDYYIKTSGALRRLQSVARSPIYQHFSETLSGVSTIRVMQGQTTRFIIENEARTDATISKTNVIQLVNRWLQVRVELMGALIVFAAAALAVLNADNLDPSLVGLALSYALSMVTYFNALVRTVSEVQNLMVSVERVTEYSEKPTEAPTVTGIQVPENWPQQGRVVFKNYSTRYREGLDLVVKDISFSVEPAEKVGIVGRTGAGKSSLTLALFRIIEAADSYWAKASDPSAEFSPPFESTMFASSAGGSIEIDGIDISTLGLRDLRQHLAIIPQDPTLFAGTLRQNLDPFTEHSDAELWQALDRAHLKEHISSTTSSSPSPPGGGTQGQGLDYEVSQNGENFSVGQRALICLARALLRKTKVLILDEATAAVDVETDDLIQKTIRKEFADRTILTIAHRIKTVMDSDKILVLEKGSVKEFEAPKVLLKQKESLFYSLAQQAGEI
ncbi:Canalicular multispecific organic anion transporter 2 [Linnemannia zychae]|nr:Canalicular multispecific organic anion transporter 2 [Linnemannia zychae]